MSDIFTPEEKAHREEVLGSMYPSMSPHQVSDREKRSLTREEILELRLEAFNNRASSSHFPTHILQACREELKKRVETHASLVGLQKELAEDVDLDFDRLTQSAASRDNPHLDGVYESMDNEPDLFG